LVGGGVAFGDKDYGYDIQRLRLELIDLWLPRMTVAIFVSPTQAGISPPRCLSQFSTTLFQNWHRLWESRRTTLRNYGLVFSQIHAYSSLDTTRMSLRRE
jgi:hypothetical protein